MKSVVLAFVVCFALTSAVPQQSLTEKEARNVVVDTILAALERYRQAVINGGYDPYYRARAEVDFADTIVPSRLLSGLLIAHDLRKHGGSTFEVNELIYVNHILRYDISIADASASIGNGYFLGTVLDLFDVDAHLAGRVGVRDVRVRGTAHVDISNGIRVSDVLLILTVGGVDSEITSLRVNEHELHEIANQVLGHTIPNFIHENQTLVSVVLSTIVEEIFARVF